jgi:hypothetical protein
MKTNLLTSLIALGLPTLFAGTLRAENLDIVKIKATLVVEAGETEDPSMIKYHTRKVRILTKDVLKLAADALGYADTTFGTGQTLRLGFSSSLANSPGGSFLLVDSTGTNAVLNLDHALGDIGGYFNMTGNSGIFSGRVLYSNNDQKYLEPSLSFVNYHDGNAATDGKLHSFQLIGLQMSRNRLDNFKYKESFTLSGAGDAWDGNFENLVGVIVSGKVWGKGKGLIELPPQPE